jgi:hypothetical protein
VPFTLAHPAAILPLRGWRYVRTMPLILGALVPDLPYYVPGSIERYIPETHRFEASFTIDLALGYAALALVYGLRKPLTALLSARARFLCLSAVEPFARPREWLFAALAILIGIWTHLLWDSFTHLDGWMVRRVDALSAPVTIGDYSGPVCHILQYVSSVVGLLVVAIWYVRLPGGRALARTPTAARSAAGPVLLLVVAAALLIGAVQATEHYYSGHSVYRTLHVLLTRSVAWFGLLYLVAGTIVTLEHAHEGVSDRIV